MRTHRAALAIVIAVSSNLAGFLSAQSGSTSPRHFATVDAGTSSPGPLGSLRSRNRYQQVHHDLPTRPRLVRGLAFGRDSVRTTFVTFTVELELRRSDANRSPATPSPNFDDNLRQNPLLVFAREFSTPGRDADDLAQRHHERAIRCRGGARRQCRSRALDAAGRWRL
jgi:hypothetical protein